MTALPGDMSLQIGGAMDISGIAIAVLLATVGLRLGLVLVVVWLIVPRRVRCPLCDEPLVGVRLAPPARWLRLETRWCLACGWQGVGKCARTRAPVPAVSRRPEPDRWKTRWDDDGQWTAVEDGWRT